MGWDGWAGWIIPLCFVYKFSAHFRITSLSDSNWEENKHETAIAAEITFFYTKPWDLRIFFPPRICAELQLTFEPSWISAELQTQMSLYSQQASAITFTCIHGKQNYNSTPFEISGIQGEQNNPNNIHLLNCTIYDCNCIQERRTRPSTQRQECF